MVVAVVGVLVVGGMVGGVVGRGSGGELTVEAVPSPDAPSFMIDPGAPAHPDADREALPVGVPPITVGEWRARPRAPVEVPAAHVGAWTGTELIVFGGDGEVAAFDPDAGEWRGVSRPPRSVRGVPAPIWAGDELLVWSRDGEAGLRLGAGLAYRPGSDAWRSITPPPAAPISAAVAVWTGREVVVVGPRGALAYDPATDGWRRLASPDQAAVFWAGAVWTGREVVVWGGRSQGGRGQGGAMPAFAEAYDPRRDAWRRLPPPPTNEAASAPAVWTGEEVVLWGTPAVGGEVPTAAALDPEAPRWRMFPPAPAAAGQEATRRVYGHSAVWTGDEVVFHGGYPRSLGLVLDPASGRWAVLPRRPGLVNHVAAWTGESMLVWGGYGRRGPTGGLVEWRPFGPRRPPF